MAKGMSTALAVAGQHLPVNGERLGTVDHPISGAGGELVRFPSGVYAIHQAGVYRACPQPWARAEHRRGQTK